ncbi:MAG: sugar phosphate isomerase/epimerase [Elusimicrobia bacterium]|nr:sugar phosphate isomerase/epimerase [Elusimicrobiota bacterium]
MKIGAVNDFRNDLCDEIRRISAEGFDFVDLTLEPLFSHAVDAASVKEVVDETGIEVIGHTSPFLPVIFPLKKIRDVSIEEFVKYIDFFKALEVDLMNVHPSLNGTLMDEDSVFKYNKEFITKINQICRDKGITLMVESVLAPFNTPESFERLLEGLDDVMVHVDVGHCNINTPKNLTEDFFKTFGDRIVHVHFSDNTGHRDSHLPLGTGNIDWKKIVSILRKYNYDSTITLEVFSQDREYLLLSKRFLENILNSE